MAEYNIDDRREYKKILRDIYIDKKRKNMKEYMNIFYENKKKTDDSKKDLKQYFIYIKDGDQKN